NPTGAAFTRQRAAELSSVLATRPEALVIEDDHLGPVSGTKRFTTVRERGRWATVRSVSKSLGPDLRLAVVSGDRQTVNRVQSRMILGTQWVSQLLQQLVEALLYDRNVNALVKWESV